MSVEKITNPSTLNIGYNDNGKNQQSKVNADSTSVFDAYKTDSDNQIPYNLDKELQEIKDKQGFLGKVWNGFKNLTGLGVSSKDVEMSIEQYKNGEISLEEAKSEIEKFDKKQEGAVNLFSNISTGIISTAIAVGAVATGGLTAVAAGAIVGGASKAGLKTLDRATNNIKGDAIDTKQILKDGLTGAIDGAASALTAGMVKGAQAGLAVKEAVKEGVINGAKAGAISGGITGASDYTIDAVMEDDVKFSFGTLAKSTVQTMLFGAFTGAAMGGITNGIGQNRLNKANIQTQKTNIPKEPELNPTKTEAKGTNLSESLDAKSGDMAKVQNTDVPKEPELNPTKTEAKGTNLSESLDAKLKTNAKNMAKTYKDNIKKVQSDFEEMFGDLDSVSKVSGRSKGEKSIFDKLSNKYGKNLNSTNVDDCFQMIGDGYGVRVQLKDLDENQARQIIEDTLEGTSKTYDDFIGALKSGEPLESKYIEALDTLKEAQTDEFVNEFIKKIKNKEIILADDEFNNYGDEITSYFTNRQLKKIADAYSEANNGAQLAFVNKTQLDDIPYDTPKFKTTDTGETVSKSYKELTEKQIKKATKDSGYTTAQANIKSAKTNGAMLADTELQIRGTKVNDVAEVEHIPYDIRKGKITLNDEKYSNVYSIIKGMDEDSYKAYLKYFNDTYKTAILNERGLKEFTPPAMPDNLRFANKNVLDKLGISNIEPESALTPEMISKISIEGLNHC